jgi:PKD repeat protein
MKARTWRTGVVLLSFLALAAVIGVAQAPVAPKGIIATPPDSELEVRISVDKGAYAIGEAITIYYEVNKPAYIYIWDIQPDGIPNQLFPYPSSGTPNNYVQAGEHILGPPPGYPGWVVAPPTGTEYLQILATTSPVQPFAYMTHDPAAFQQSIEAQILGILPVEERSWNFTSFEIVSGTPPSYGIVTINSSPSGALISIDGEYAGYTPRTLFVEQGFHRVSVTKPGYLGWNAVRFIIPGLTSRINVTLEPLVSVNTPPVALFSYSPASPGVAEWIQFDGSASVDPDGTITSYSWNFGDGSTGYGSSAWQRFMAAGTYTVTLIVTDNDGASDSISQTIQVGPTNQAPSAVFAFSPTNPAVNGWVQFDGSGSADPDGSIVTYSWSFGDGTSDTGVVAWHRFAAPGTYLVALTVQDNDGVSDSTSQAIQVGPTNLPPTAAFTYSPASPSVAEWVQFDGTGSSDPDGTITEHTWSFGDGTSPAEGSVIYHQFGVPGTYLVTLTVEDNDGGSDSTSRTIVVGTATQPPVAAFTYSPLTPTVGQPILLNAQSSYDPDGTIVSYLWDLDGNGSDDLSGSLGQVTYQSPGTVFVRLTVIDNDGLSSTTTQPIVVSSGGGTPIGGSPPMGSTPGFFVWGTDSWHITVNAGAGWVGPHNYRIELRTDGSFQNVGQTTDSGPGATPVAPLGILPTPTEGGRTLIYEGSLQTGRIDHTFRIPDSQSMWLHLQLDVDGDGDLETSSSFVYLRYSMVNPPTSPFVVGLPSGSTAKLTPSLDFRIGNAITYTETTRFVYWTTTISNLESP